MRLNEIQLNEFQFLKGLKDLALPSCPTMLIIIIIVIIIIEKYREMWRL